VSHSAAQDGGVQHAFAMHVVHVLAAAAQQAQILDALDRRAYELRDKSAHAYLRRENAVGASIVLEMLSTIGPLRSLSARALSHSGSLMKAPHRRSRSARSFHSSK
jgi:hypothetical protein